MTILNYSEAILSYSNEQVEQILNAVPKLSTSAIEARGCDYIQRQLIMKGLNLRIPAMSILYFQLGPSNIGGIHIDSNLNNPDVDVAFALNIPLVNCEHVRMNWFIPKFPNSTFSTISGASNGDPAPWMPVDRGLCIDSVNYNKPLFVKINDWHSVDNLSVDKTAQFISVRFHKKIDIELVKKMIGPA